MSLNNNNNNNKRKSNSNKKKKKKVKGENTCESKLLNLQLFAYKFLYYDTVTRLFFITNLSINTDIQTDRQTDTDIHTESI